MLFKIAAKVYCSPLHFWPAWTLHSQIVYVCASSFEYPRNFHLHSSVQKGFLCPLTYLQFLNSHHYQERHTACSDFTLFSWHLIFWLLVSRLECQHLGDLPEIWSVHICTSVNTSAWCRTFSPNLSDQATSRAQLRRIFDTNLKMMFIHVYMFIDISQSGFPKAIGWFSSWGSH